MPAGRSRPTLCGAPERNNLDFNSLLHLISVTWTPELVKAELGLEDVHIETCLAAINNVTVIELTSYLPVAGANALKKRTAYFIAIRWSKKQVILILLSYLVHTRNANTWIYAMCEVLDPRGTQK